MLYISLRNTLKLLRSKVSFLHAIFNHIWLFIQLHARSRKSSNVKQSCWPWFFMHYHCLMYPGKYWKKNNLVIFSLFWKLLNYPKLGQAHKLLKEEDYTNPGENWTSIASYIWPRYDNTIIVKILGINTEQEKSQSTHNMSASTLISDKLINGARQSFFQKF